MKPNSVQAAHLSPEMPPFVSPVVPSVLHCRQPDCGQRLYTDNDLETGLEAVALVVRENRAKHFKKIYAAQCSLRNDTRFPEPLAVPKAPVCYKNTLHISTARVWSQLLYERRKAIADNVTGGDCSVVAHFAQAREHILELYQGRG